MTVLDIKDRKILYELDLNARQSLTQIGKKVGLKKDVVSYRIKKLQDEGIIKNFWTAINTFKLGYLVFRIYITFQYTNQNVMDSIIRKFVDYKNTWTVYSTYFSDFDIGIIVWVKNIFEFYQFWDKILDEYEDYFQKYIVSIYSQAICYKKSFLIANYNNKSDRKMYAATSGESFVNIDEIDYILLNEIAIEARIPIIDLAEKLDCSSSTVQYRIKSLIKKGVIQAFRVNIDLSKFNLQEFTIDIYLKQHKQKNSIIKYLEKKPYFIGLNLAVGWSDIEPELIVKNVDELNPILGEVNANFPDTIKKQNYWVIKQRFKERWLPELY